MRKHRWRLDRPPTQKPMSAAERMRRMRARRKANGFKLIATWISRHKRTPPLELRLVQARSLALHVLVATRIEEQPQLLEVAHQSLVRWRERGSATPAGAIRDWRKLLRRPWPEISASMTEQSEAGVRLRSTTPFLGVLTRHERTRLYAAFRIKRPLRVLTGGVGPSL